MLTSWVFLFGALASSVRAQTGDPAPPTYHTLSAVVEIDSTDHSIAFTWRDYDKRYWDAGSGWRWVRVSSAHSVLRILSEKTAVVLRLPFGKIAFTPSLFLVDPRDLREIREYRELVPEAPARGRVRLKAFQVTPSEKELRQNPMTRAELALRLRIETGAYGTITGISVPADLWRRFRPLAERLARIDELTTFRSPGLTGEGSTARLMSGVFSQLPAGKKILFGFEPAEGGWRDVARPDEWVYLRGFGTIVWDNDQARFNTSKKAKARRTQSVTPIQGNFLGKACDFAEDELWFDPKKQEIGRLAPNILYPLRRTDGSHSGEDGFDFPHSIKSNETDPRRADVKVGTPFVVPDQAQEDEKKKK